MINIREPQERDAASLVELICRFPTPTLPANDVIRAILEAKLQDSSSYLLVAEERSRLIGYVSGYRHAAFYAGGATAWVDEILVEENKRGGNIGRMLMTAFEQRASADGCKLVALATAGAGPFYSKLGYQTKAGYYKKYLRSAEG